ncbi:MAG: hypothetical protein SOX61_04620 [Prevotella sp.]|nr:hypothetical protein [Prevotellaceae bacterium]MDY3252306.1 hypothetical protein [Prevotella sp.]
MEEKKNLSCSALLIDRNDDCINNVYFFTLISMTALSLSSVRMSEPLSKRY